MSQRYTSISFEFFKEKSFDSALVYINKAVETNEKDNSQTWQLRGYLYKILESEATKEYREIALNSFIQGYKSNATKKDSIEIKKHLTQINGRYYNDVVSQIKANELEFVEKSYKTYRQNCLALDLEHEKFRTLDIKIYNALAGSYIEFNKEKTSSEKIEFYHKAIHYYELILTIDSLNYKANYGVGLSYYNQAVDLIMDMNPFETSIDEIDVIQNKSIDLFKKGEPYFLKAYAVRPNELEVLEGLSGIYNSMNEDKKFKYFEELLEGVKKEDE